MSKTFVGRQGKDAINKLEKKKKMPKTLLLYPGSENKRSERVTHKKESLFPCSGLAPEAPEGRPLPGSLGVPREGCLAHSNCQ